MVVEQAESSELDGMPPWEKFLSGMCDDYEIDALRNLRDKLERFFDKLDRMEKRQGKAPAEWLRTHPLSTSRIEKATTLIENKNYRYGQ